MSGQSFFQDERSGARPAIPPSVGAGASPGIYFPGAQIPTTDFQAVRDARRTTPLWFLVDLTSARSIAAGTHAVIEIQGNAFYADPLQDGTGLNIAGYATVHFQDTNLSPIGTPLTVGPQFIALVPFTRILLENIAQPGKFLRIIYGVDINFSPGLNASVTITGATGIRSLGQNYTTSFASTTALAANGTEQVWAPGTNVNGILLHQAHLAAASAAVSTTNLQAKTGAAPGTLIAGDVILQNTNTKDIAAAFASFLCFAQMPTPILVPTGKGLWRFSNNLETSGLNSELFTIN